MIGYFVIILLAAGSVLAAALFFRHRQKQVMDGLSDMLEAAINGTFSETTFDESRQSSLENRLAQYLAASELSVRSIDAEREKIKGTDRRYFPSDADAAFEYFIVYGTAGGRTAGGSSTGFRKKAAAAE